MTDRINQIMVRLRKLEQFIETVEVLSKLYTEFDAGQWAALVESIAALQSEMSSVGSAIQTAVALNAKKSLDQDSYNTEYRVLAARYESPQAEMERWEIDRAARLEKDDIIAVSLQEVAEVKDFDIEFSGARWNAIVEEVRVQKNSMVFIFVNGRWRCRRLAGDAENIGGVGSMAALLVFFYGSF